MNILVTNDDGWGSAGIETLAQVARGLGDVWILAPAQPMSGISHQLTFEQPMKLTQQENQSYSLTGTPADCVRVAMVQLGVTFDWVFSGVNQGGNLGADIHVSGTVAAAREATLFGVRAVALSQYLQGFRHAFEWERSHELVGRVLPTLLESDLRPGEFFNVNLPDTHGAPVDQVRCVHTENDRLPLPVAYQQLDNGRIMYCGSYGDRQRTDGLDVDVCFSGDVAITRH